ncbi:uncharacterized protein LOC106942873 [Poecilia latipinna]|uniref:uncharacterized protein LOC106942873 n=1 Tax=Poecilia latipinna TaxID=48699 RepID=UPI00072EC105|nr:PREDICTED: uncharacterized protein LOC106942873 [Poecilia latipinna]XP_016523271.1 PREDICTED: uncharacterized protein LOC107835409 [Poecilia formosa]
MFYQFTVTPESRNYLKFLWWKGGDLEKEPQEYRMAVHLFGAASSPGCANFGLKHLGQQHKTNYPQAATFIEKNFYVDDGLISVPSVEEAKKLIIVSQELCKKGGLRLHKFNSNMEAALACLGPSEVATAIEPHDLDPASSECALGIQWLIKNDTFIFNIGLKDQPSTRRSCLSIIASLYDPLGFIAPFTLSGKLILQELCQRGVGWHDPLPEDIKPWWEKWINDLQRLKEISIPRCYHPADFHNVVRVELHHFSDASCVGHGACSYLRFINDKGEVHCSLVIAKARVAPSKITSIPRLELAAAVVSTKVSVMLRCELDMKIDQEFFWTDSQVVLGYTIQVLVTEVKSSNDILERLNRFSSWTTLLRVISRIKRLGSKQQHSEHVTVEEVQRAAETVIKIVQQQNFPNEVKILEGEKNIPNTSTLCSLDPIWSEGLLRVSGRLKQSSLCFTVKHPVILPNNSHITKLIVSHYHAKTCHQGRGQTQMELRINGFWVIGGSKLVAKLIHDCVFCRKLRRPMEKQRMADLPKERVESSAPFTYSGMDCFGPFIVKKARKEYKRYGQIFTCTTRATTLLYSNLELSISKCLKICHLTHS